MSEMRLVSLKCPACSGKLDIGPSIETFACGYCGANVRVERGGNIIALNLLTDAMVGVQRGTDRTAAELAIRRLGQEAAVLQVEASNHLAEHDRIETKWAREIAAIQPSDRLLPMAFLSAIVFIPTMIILSMASWINPAVAMVLSAFATGAVVRYAWRSLHNQQQNLRTEKMEMRDREMEPILNAAKDAKKRLDLVKSKLHAQHQIVDAHD